MKVRSVRSEKRCRNPKEFPKFSLPEIAFAGRSNVGKSSLINSLLHRHGLVAVSSKPGKTRAIDFFLVNDEFRLVDLPGYGFARVSKEMQKSWKYLIEAYLKNRMSLVSVVWILDIRRDLSDQDRMLFEWFQAFSIPCIPVCTKADKIPFGQRAKRKKALQTALADDVDLVVYSAKTGLGKAELWKKIRAAISLPDVNLSSGSL